MKYTYIYDEYHPDWDYVLSLLKLIKSTQQYKKLCKGEVLAEALGSLDYEYIYVVGLCSESKLDFDLPLKTLLPTVSGFVIAEFIEEDVKYHNLYVRVICDNNHCGGKLMDALKYYAVDEEYDLITLDSIPSAMGFYYKKGYRFGDNKNINKHFENSSIDEFLEFLVRTDYMNGEQDFINDGVRMELKL